MEILSSFLIIEYSSGGEAAFVGAMSSLLLTVMVFIFKSIFGSKPKEQKSSEKIQNDLNKHYEKPNPSLEKNCNSTTIDLYSELLEKCSPKNFMDPYDHEKVNYANEIYKQLIDCKGNSKDLYLIKIQAEDKLGIKISTSGLYEELKEACNPIRFADPQNYDSEKVKVANDLYQRVLLYKDDYAELEQIKKTAESLGFYKNEQPNVKNTAISTSTDEERKEDQVRIGEIIAFIFTIIGLLIIAIGFVMAYNN